MNIVFMGYGICLGKNKNKRKKKKSALASEWAATNSCLRIPNTKKSELITNYMPAFNSVFLVFIIMHSSRCFANECFFLFENIKKHTLNANGIKRKICVFYRHNNRCCPTLTTVLAAHYTNWTQIRIKYILSFFFFRLLLLQ